MKKILAIAAFVLVGCQNDPLSVSRTDNAQFDVQLLFEHDGCKVYRFHDGSHTVYYTTCKGQTTHDETRNNGKSSHTDTYQNSTEVTK